MDELSVGSIVSTGFNKGFKNLAAIVVNFLLFCLTFWIPYLNVGTFIGLTAGLAAKASRDEAISFTEIFNPVYRKRMGEYFLVGGFMGMGIMAGTLLLFIPGMVIGIAWMLAPLFVVDKEMNPIEAINKSNSVTYGKKVTIFLGMLVINIIIGLAIGIVVGILGLIHPIVAGIAAIICIAIAASIIISVQGYIYSALGQK
jgi:hypothetical protein